MIRVGGVFFASATAEEKDRTCKISEFSHSSGEALRAAP